MDAKKIALIFGGIFVAVGILGFIPNPLVAPDGLFVVNDMHNYVHLITGAVFLAGAFVGGGSNAQLITRIVGIGYALVAILGFFSGDMLLGLIQINDADRWLHVGLAVVLLIAGFGLGKSAKN